MLVKHSITYLVAYYYGICVVYLEIGMLVLRFFIKKIIDTAVLQNWHMTKQRRWASDICVFSVCKQSLFIFVTVL